MKVSIIGGGGLVGSCAASALQFGGIVREIALVDVNLELAEGQALDLLHGASLTSDQKIYGCGTEAVKDSDVICITAGLRRKPDENAHRGKENHRRTHQQRCLDRDRQSCESGENEHIKGA